LVKFFLLIFISSILLFANLQEKIESFTPADKYIQQENLIRVLFSDVDSFYRSSDGNVDSLKVIKVLEDNGLFELFYDAPRALNMEFITKKNPLIFMKVIKESLDSLGYNYFLTTRALKKDDEFVWTINLKTKHLINPILFSKELSKRGCSVDDISKEKSNLWIYKINSDNAKLNAKDIDTNVNFKLQKSIEPYLIYSKKAQEIKIKTSFSDHWFPYVVFLDAALHVIYQTKIDERTYVLKLKIPQTCVYIRIGDIYTMENIKHGLGIYLKSDD